MRKLGIITIASFSLGLMACGQDNIDKARQDFDSPTGSTSNKDAVMAVDAQRNGASPVMGLAAGGVPGALTATGKSRALDQVSVRAWQPRADMLFKAYAARKAGLAVPQRQAIVGEGCADSMEAEAAYEELWQELFTDAIFGGSSASGDAEYTVDVGACSNGELSGDLSIYIKIEVEEDNMSFEVTQTMNVCETAGAKACVNGQTTMLSTATSNGNGDVSSAEVIAYWEVEGSWDDDTGARRNTKLKGGIRIAGATNMGTDTASIEYLFYVLLPDGEEVSYVWTLTATNAGGMGTVTWSLRGSDGSLDCTANEQMVTCTGSADINYTSAEVDALESAWF